MIVLDVTLNLEPQKSFIEEIAPDLIATFLAFALGYISNLVIHRYQTKASKKKETENLLYRFELTTEQYYLARKEREKALAMVKEYDVYSKFCNTDEKIFFKQLKHDYILRDQDLIQKCNLIHAEMRNIASSIYHYSPDIKKTLLDLINVYAGTYEYSFDDWMNPFFLREGDFALRKKQEYALLFHHRIESRLRAIQEYTQKNSPFNRQK